MSPPPCFPCSKGTGVQADPEFYGPLQYAAAWSWAGLGLLLLVAAWYAWVFAATRRRGSAGAGPRGSGLTDLAALKAVYLQRIDDVEQEAAAGNLGERESHQEISRLLRKFVRDATGVDALRMTQADLAGHPLPAAAATVGELYPAEFGPGPLPPVARSAASARRTVETWS